MKTPIKIHNDVITAKRAMDKLEIEFRGDGYETKRISPIGFYLVLDDGKVHFYWEKGVIYQEIKENEDL